MCTILAAVQVWPDQPLVIAANRDEALDRPATGPRVCRASTRCCRVCWSPRCTIQSLARSILSKRGGRAILVLSSQQSQAKAGAQERPAQSGAKDQQGYSFFSLKNSEFAQIDQLLSSKQISLDLFVFEAAILLRPADFFAVTRTSTGFCHFFEDFSDRSFDLFFRQLWACLTKDVLWDCAVKVRVSESWRKRLPSHPQELGVAELLELGPISE